MDGARTLRSNDVAVGQDLSEPSAVAPHEFASALAAAKTQQNGTPYAGATGASQVPNPEGGSAPHDDAKCLSLDEGPVTFWGGGLDLSMGVGAGFGFYKFSVPSGESGWVASGAGFVGLGGSLGGTYGRVNKLGNFLGDGYRMDAELPTVPMVGGEAIFSSSGELAGGAFTVAAGGGVYGGRTKTKLISSSAPVCTDDTPKPAVAEYDNQPITPFTWEEFLERMP